MRSSLCRSSSLLIKSYSTKYVRKLSTDYQSALSDASRLLSPSTQQITLRALLKDTLCFDGDNMMNSTTTNAIASSHASIDLNLNHPLIATIK